MKRTLIGLLCLAIVLAGCAAPGPTQTAPPEPESSHAETSGTQPTEPAPGLPLMEQAVALGDGGNLWYIPNEALEGMTHPELRLFGDGLLLGAHIRSQYVLRHIRLTDGALLNEYAVSASPGVKLCTGSDCVGLLDSGTNSVLLLNEDLTLKRTQSIPTEGDSWYLSPSLDTLYRFYEDRGLLARDLQTEQEHWILENAVFAGVIGSETDYVLFEYTDRADQRTYTRCLNLSTGALEPVPDFGSVSTGLRRQDTWLFRKAGAAGEYILSADGAAGEYILSADGAAASFPWEHSDVTLLSPKNHLLLTDSSGRKLQLYGTDGRFVSACALPEAEYAAAGTELVWSDDWNGYFLIDTVEGSSRLMFWDTDVPVEGTDLALIPIESAPAPAQVMAAEYYERAQALSERFGVTILIAEQCAEEYSSYNTYHLTDPGFLGEALELLESCMEQYPEGFFRQLPYGSFDRIQIELVGGLAAKPDAANRPESTAAFVQERDGYICIVMDGFVLLPETVYHEFSHVIDRRLAWDATIRPEALYSEEVWLSLQPEGFAYAKSYAHMPEQTLQYADLGYFVSDYAMTYPTEDRATLFADAMAQTPLLKERPALLAKLDYYARCIRDCFDTAGWPRQTAWELPLIPNAGG